MFLAVSMPSRHLRCKFSQLFRYSKTDIGRFVLSLRCFDDKEMKRLYTYLIVLTGFCLSAMAQEKIGSGIEIDKMVHNFGDIMLGSGPVSCTFTVKNIGDKPAVIYNVTTTCGCTDVEWTKEPIRPGKEGKISVTYSNDEGPYPFDKSLTVYLSDVKKPVILKLRGVSMERKKPLEEMYPVHFGNLAVKDDVNKCGNLEQGGHKSEAVMVANLSDAPLSVSFTDVSPNLEVKVTPNPIPARGTAEMTFTVSADRGLWGKNMYWATPVVNGKTYVNDNGESRLGFWAFTKENFNDMTDEERAKGPRPMFKESTFSFGKMKKGATVHASYTFKNEGKSPFRVYRVNADACCWSHSDIPVAAPGESVTFRVHVDTKDMPVGEALIIVTLTTNSPLRPIVNLFVAGYIE